MPANDPPSISHPPAVTITTWKGALYWSARTCRGDDVVADVPIDPDAVCQQPGVCVVHDPPGTVVPW